MDTEKIWICKIFMPWNVDTARKTAVDWPSIKVGWSNGIHRMSREQLLIFLMVLSNLVPRAFPLKNGKSPGDEVGY